VAQPCAIDAASHNECGLVTASDFVQFFEGKSNRGGVECRHAAWKRTGAGGSFSWGAPKAEIRNAAATTSRCVGSDKVARRSCDRPAIIPAPLLLLGRCCAETLLAI
jgi:hypothetical protein